MEPKFERATKTSHAYVGRINGKTYVVPHAFYNSQSGEQHATPIRHAIVTSQTHVQHHNPNLAPEEVARVHAHVNMIHGKSLTEESVMIQEQVFRVTDHKGATHEVSAKDASEAKKRLVSGHVTGEQIPMTQWHKIHIETKQLEEKVLTAAETAKKEEIVKSMKKKVQGFKERYGKKAKSVMYATATKQAKKLAEETEQLDELVKPSKVKSFLHKLMTGSSPKENARRIKGETQSMSDHELHSLHKSNNKSFQKGKNTEYGSPQHIQQRAIHREVERRASKPKTMDMSKFVKKDLREEQLDEAANFMSTYKRNESQNRHTANILHLAKHFGTKADQAQAQFYADELKKHGHQPHHEAAYDLHQKLWPLAQKAHTLSELHQSDYSWHKEVGAQKTPAPGHAYHASSDAELHKLHSFHSAKATSTIRTDPQKAKRHQEYADTAKQILSHRQSSLKEHSDTFHMVKSVLHETMTRKHFQQVADVIKSHPDAEKRKELAAHHAEIFKKSNPRFDHKRFYAAANVPLQEDTEQLDELKRSTVASYVSKAAPSLASHSYMSAKARGYEAGSTHPISKTHFGKEAEKYEKKTEKREKGIQRASKRLV